MPFKVTDLMIDVLPEAGAAQDMLAMAEGPGNDDEMQCPTAMTQGQTAECKDDEDEDDDLCPNMSNVQQSAACTGVSQAEEGYPRLAEERRMAALGALRRQLRDTLTIQPAG